MQFVHPNMDIFKLIPKQTVCPLFDNQITARNDYAQVDKARCSQVDYQFQNIFGFFIKLLNL